MQAIIFLDDIHSLAYGCFAMQGPFRGSVCLTKPVFSDHDPPWLVW